MSEGPIYPDTVYLEMTLPSTKAACAHLATTPYAVVPNIQQFQGQLYTQCMYRTSGAVFT